MAAAYAAYPERFIRAIPQPPALPTVWLQVTLDGLARELDWRSPAVGGERTPAPG